MYWKIGWIKPTAGLQQPPETPPIAFKTPKSDIPTKKQLMTPSFAPLWYFTLKIIDTNMNVPTSSAANILPWKCPYPGFRIAIFVAIVSSHAILE